MELLNNLALGLSVAVSFQNLSMRCWAACSAR